MAIKVSSEKFVDTWTAAHKGNHNVAWLIRQLDNAITHQGATQRAVRMRKRGIDLPTLPRYDEGDTNRLNYRIAKGMVS